MAQETMAQSISSGSMTLDARQHAPSLSFDIVSAAAEPYAATPTLRFTLGVRSDSDCMVRSVLLSTQLRINVTRRSYQADEQQRLLEVFGTPDRWSDTLKSLYWTHTTTVIPQFERQTEIALLVPCTYDFDVVASKYLHAVEGGDIPLDFFFSGSVFYDDTEGSLRTARLSWETESSWRMPAQVWKDLMHAYFPNDAWVRIRRETFDRLHAFRSARALPTWDRTIETMLDHE